MSANGQLLSGQRSVTHKALEQRTRRAVHGLQLLGIQPGDCIALFLRNDFAFFEASFAATTLGAYPVPLNWHLVSDEVVYVLEDCRARALIAHSDLLRVHPKVLQATSRLGISVFVVPTPVEVQKAFNLEPSTCALPHDLCEWSQWLNQFDPIASQHPTLTQSMIYTSGTTGKPKGVRREGQQLEHATRFAKVRDWIYGIRKGARSLLAGPLYHSAPNSFGLRAARASQLLVLMPRFSPVTFLKLVEHHAITNAFVVPTMLVRLLKLPESVRATIDVSSLEHVMVAAAPCPAYVKQAMIEWWGPVVHEFYGSTEMGYMTVCNSEESLSRPGTVGRPINGAVLKALDEQGKEVACGEPGELYGRLAGFPDFTYHNRAEERAACERDGLISCGDVGYFDRDGYLFLCDRRREMVISGGVNIYPAEIESVLVAMPGVRDCAVIGIPHEEFGEQLLALVQLDAAHAPAPNEGDINAWLRKRLAGYKVPRTIEFRSDLPRDDSGKLFKRRLRAPYWCGRQRHI